MRFVFILNPLIILIGLFIPGKLIAQNSDKVDSLKREINSNIDSLSKFEIFLEISVNSSSPDDICNYGEKAYLLAKFLNDDKKTALSLYQIGRGNILKGDLHKGVDYLYNSLTLFERDGNSNGQASACDLISGAYLSMKSFNRAIEYEKKAIGLTFDNKIRKAGFINNLGEIYRVWSRLDSALYYFNQSKFLYDEVNYDLGLAYSLGNIGLVHAELYQYDSAEFYINKATVILEVLGDRYPIAVYQTYMADIYRDKQEWERALEYAHSSLKIAEEEGLKEQIRDASLKLSELYHDTNEFEKAYDYQSQYIAFRDSINNEDVIRKMADLRTEYEVSKKQTEVDLLEQRRENERWVLFSLASVLGFISVVAFFTFRNNLARKRTNILLSAQKSKIETQNDKLEGLIKMKDKFFGIISHDLRSPVNSLNGIAQLLRHYVKTKNTDEIEQLSGLIDKSVENLSELLDNLLNWALSQQGALPYYPKNIPFNPQISNVVDVFKNAALAKSIEINIDVEEGLEIYADEDSLHALLRNILNNSLKFTPVNGRIEINAKSVLKNVEIKITDNGMGMNDYQLRNLFKVNKKKVNKGTMGEKGSGLGMLLCKELVKLNKGKINAESELGKGTQIKIELPASK